MVSNVQLYEKYFVENSFERVNLFKQLRNTYGINSAIYPGSFVHIAPSFIFERTAYIDNDKRVGKFFSDPEIIKFVESKKLYNKKPEIVAFQQDYTKKLPEDIGTYDLLISQYAGFVSRDCKKYLKDGGLLLANSSHGDASLAYLDPEYELVAVANYKHETWSISSKNLSEYFIPKNGKHPPQSTILETMKGVGYKKTAANYIFIKISK